MGNSILKECGLSNKSEQENKNLEILIRKRLLNNKHNCYDKTQSKKEKNMIDEAFEFDPNYDYPCRPMQQIEKLSPKTRQKLQKDLSQKNITSYNIYKSYEDANNFNDVTDDLTFTSDNTKINKLNNYNNKMYTKTEMERESVNSNQSQPDIKVMNDFIKYHNDIENEVSLNVSTTNQKTFDNPAFHDKLTYQEKRRIETEFGFENILDDDEV